MWGKSTVTYWLSCWWTKKEGREVTTSVHLTGGRCTTHSRLTTRIEERGMVGWSWTAHRTNHPTKIIHTAIDRHVSKQCNRWTSNVYWLGWSHMTTEQWRASFTHFRSLTSTNCYLYFLSRQALAFWHPHFMTLKACSQYWRKVLRRVKFCE